MENGNNERIRELEQQIQELRATNSKLHSIIEDYKAKEQSISSAIIASMEHANQLETSRKKLYNLDIQRSRLMYLKMEQVIKELYTKHPELKQDDKLQDMSNRFKSIIYNDLNERDNMSNNMDSFVQPVTDDPIKKLLHNIISCIDTKKPDEDFDKPKDNKASNQPNEITNPSGFDFDEALHPTMSLDEILKSFNLGKKSS